MLRKRYEIPGLAFSLVADPDARGDQALPQLKLFEAEDGPVQHEVILTTVEGDDIATRGTVIWGGDLIDGTYAEFSRDGDEQQLRIPGQVAILEKSGEPVTRVEVLASAENPFYSMAPVILLDTIIRDHGLLTIHAGSLMPPGRDELVLLFAPSGFGKTTTSLALALSGYAHLGDDVVVLRQEGSDILAWGLPRALKVQRRTAAMFPELLPHLGAFSGDEDEAGLTREALAAMMPLPDPRKSYRTAAIVVVGPRSEGPARVRPISKADALSVILTDNIGILSDGVPRPQQALFRLLTKLVSTTPVFQLDAGSDPHSIAAAFDAALGIVREPATAEA
ncbi:hypothetical protein K32_17150 [Kaistia sp. 32K]|uniref:hypothetical protein n=1 Tax=Kaistia sp. 32K TaxID=2795690 RepID=UPI001915D100|nr:hypothetical protein [Kaistia sp. 32K]BCP53098.1 hypothetical protein K32_17150 [Kaistia sp. 32K]